MILLTGKIIDENRLERKKMARLGKLHVQVAPQATPGYVLKRMLATECEVTSSSSSKISSR